MNIASNLPAYWHEGRKPETLDEKVEARVHAAMMEEVKGFAGAWNEEIEAQLHYNEHRHEKKRNPPAYYEARDRLFPARWAVKAFDHDKEEVSAKVSQMIEKELKLAASAKFASPAEEFKAWLVKETQLYFTALKHPEQVFRHCSPDPEVYTRRYTILVQALRKCLTEGADEAFTFWKNNLRESFEDCRGEDISFFQPYDGGYGKKDGFTVPGETAMRPILVSNPATIQRNREEIARQSVHEARAKRFDYEVQMPPEPKKAGRPKGVKNKPKRLSPPCPVNPHVAKWQAEADRKLGYKPA